MLAPDRGPGVAQQADRAGKVTGNDVSDGGGDGRPEVKLAKT